MISPIFYITKENLLNRVLPVLTQCAQAHKKPRWLPVAKSKVFRIPKRPVISEEEKLELRRINNNYKTQMRAIRQFYHEDILKEKSSRQSASSEESLRREAEEWQACVSLNERWNAEAAAEREARLARKAEQTERYALSRMEQKDAALKELIEKASEDIRKQKELSSTFITPETLDEAIEQALANITDYNFAIDLSGQIHHGWETPVTRTTETSNV